MAQKSKIDSLKTVINSTHEDIVPPQNIEAERSLLGALMLSENAVSIALESITENSFYVKKHGMIFKGIVSLYDKGEPVDVITLTERIKNLGVMDEVGGAAYLTELTSVVPTAANVSHYINIVRDKKVLRSLIETTGMIMNKCYDTSVAINQVLDEAEKEIFKISQTKIDRSFYDMKSLMKNSLETVDKLYTKKALITGPFL